MSKDKDFINIWWSLAFFQAFVAMGGSLYFSEILGFPPCILCWYQRITMYPLVLLLGLGGYLKDKMVVIYSLILTLIGSFISGYHVLLYHKIIPEALKPCAAGVSCTTKYIEWFGFITIPLLSFCAHILIIFCLMAWMKSKNMRLKDFFLY